MIFSYKLSTDKECFVNITAKIHEAIKKSNTKNGIAIIYCPHTTAAITINENADPDVIHDMLFALNKTFPDRTEFRHAEGNSAAHLKASHIGASETVIIENGTIILGTWQSIYFCEFDGPRTRTFYVKIINSN